MSSRRLAILAAAATGVQVGAAIVASRYVVDQVGPASLALLRYAIGAACLVVPALQAGPIRIARRDILPVAVLGILQFGVLIALLNLSLQYLTSARAALIFASFPLMTLLLAAALGRERLTAVKAAGVLLTVAGVGLALADRLGDGGLHWIGVAAALASALTGAVCSVLYRPYLVRYPTVQVSFIAMLASVGFLALAAVPEGLFAAPLELALPHWGAVVFIGLSSGIGYFLWLFALRHADATDVTMFLGLSPIVAALLGAMLLGETPTWGVVAGLVAVIVGLRLGLRPAAAQPGP